MTDLERLIESNAKAIQALTSDIAEMKRDRTVLYQLVSDLTEKMGQLTSHQVRTYQLIENLDDRQSQLIKQSTATVN